MSNDDVIIAVTPNIRYRAKLYNPVTDKDCSCIANVHAHNVSCRIRSFDLDSYLYVSCKIFLDELFMLILDS